jgi:hypothetical protein
VKDRASSIDDGDTERKCLSHDAQPGIFEVSYQPKTIDKLVDGNTRVYELQRRGLSADIPVKKYTPDGSAFPDLQEPPKK